MANPFHPAARTNALNANIITVLSRSARTFNNFLLYLKKKKQTFFVTFKALPDLALSFLLYLMAHPLYSSILIMCLKNGQHSGPAI